jgi:ammonia channel protein AmtB
LPHLRDHTRADFHGVSVDVRLITPALITGAFAKRMKFSTMVFSMVIWSLLVYAPMAHMVWGKGGLFNAALGGLSAITPASGFVTRLGAHH